MTPLTRRDFLAQSALAAGALAVGPGFAEATNAAGFASRLDDAARGCDSQLPGELARTFECNAALLSPLEIVWQRRHVSPHGDVLMGMLGYPDWVQHEFFAPITYTFRWQDGMVYEFLDGMHADRVPKSPDEPVKAVPYQLERAFNGAKVYEGSPERHSVATRRIPTLVIDSRTSPKVIRPDVRFFPPRYLYDTGYWIPTRFDELGRDVEHLIPHLLSQGARIASVRQVSAEGADCLEVTVEEARFLTSFLLDRERAWAVRQRTQIVRESGQTARVLKCAEFQKVREPSLWLPRQCEITHYTCDPKLPLPPAQPLYQETVRVVAIGAARMAPEKFKLVYTRAGTLVSDATLPEARNAERGIITYRIPEDLSRLGEAIAAAW
jgi:hypothetical protein